MTERRQRGYVTPPPASIADINNLSFQARQRIALGGLTNISMFRNTPEADYQIQSFGRHEKVRSDIRKTAAEEKKGYQSYMMLCGYQDLVDHDWGADHTYEAAVAIWIADPQTDSCPILEKITIPYSVIRTPLGGTLGLMTVDFGRMITWCESVKKFVLLLWVSYDTYEKLWLLHVGTDGKVSKSNAILTMQYTEDYASTYYLKNSASIKESGKASDQPYILGFQSGATYAARRVLSINPNTLEVISNREVDRVPVLMDAAANIYQVPVYTGLNAFYRPAAFMNNGVLIEGQVVDGALYGRLLSYPNRSNLSAYKTLYVRPYTTSVPPLYTIDYLRTKNMICIGGSTSGSNSTPTLVMDSAGKVLYYLSNGTGTANQTPCQEMLRRT